MAHLRWKHETPYSAHTEAADPCRRSLSARQSGRFGLRPSLAQQSSHTDALQPALSDVFGVGQDPLSGADHMAKVRLGAFDLRGLGGLKGP
ncbi:MAG: hypothetical protein KDA51_18885 [Planctomycetales bacterium]|nr:hypothetical protein [Planctomycetales bacterium]